MTLDRRHAIGAGVLKTPVHIAYQGNHLLDGDLVSFEALLRPRGALNIHRREGEMHFLTCTILRMVCEEIIATGNTLPVHVNLPPSELTGEMLADIVGIVDEYSVPPQLIAFELLEHPFEWDRRSLAIAHALKEAGFHLYLDDYARYEWQRQIITGFNFDAVKIDGEAIHQLLFEDVLFELEALDVRNIIVEGAEDSIDLSVVRRALPKLHPETKILVQGFVYSKPNANALRQYH